jgi:ribonuclease PH
VAARHDGRDARALRPVSIEPNWHGASDGSALYRAGNTVVMCVASVDEGVKDFLKGKGRGWVTAEYVMHPRAGGRRQSRDGFNGRPLSGRAQEIARLIGRALRAAVDPLALGERTITVDCDVIQADGGTRTASVTGGMVALAVALDGLRRKGTITRPPLRALIGAVSAGLVHGERMLDLAYVEDRDAEMDLNVVATESGDLVEVQATAEGAPVARATVDALIELALAGVGQLAHAQREALSRAGVDVASLIASPAVG